MPDDLDTPPGPVGGRNGPRTLRDLVSSQSPTRTANLQTLLATSDASSGSLRLGFPSGDQLARFVAGQHARLFANLPLPEPLKHTAGGHLERKRFFMGGRIAAPDLVFTGPEAELVLVFTASPLSASTRLPDLRAVELVAALGHTAHGVLITPEPDAETADRVTEYIGTLATPLHWVRYRIELTILD